MITKRIVTWRPEFQSLYKGIDAQKVADEIVTIGESVTPQQIVEKARLEDTELHKCFEWNDKTAAEMYRITQARRVVQHLVIQNTAPEKEDQTPLRFLVQPQNGKGYKPIETVFRNEDEYQQLLMQAMSELHAFKQKYARLSELQEIFDMIA